MKNKQQRVLQALRRVLNFGAANPTIIPLATGSSDTWSTLTRQLAGIGTIVAQVTDAASEQLRHAASVTLAATSEPVLRTTLREEMHAIAQVAQALKNTIPGIGILRMPKSRLSAEALVKHADTMMKQASTYEPVLIEHGLPADVIAQLKAAIPPLVTSIDTRGSARTTQVAASKDISGGLSLGLQYIRLMDASLSKSLKSNPPKLAEWKNAKRVTTKGVISMNSSTAATTAPIGAASSAPTPEATASAA